MLHVFLSQILKYKLNKWRMTHIWSDSFIVELNVQNLDFLFKYIF